MNIMYICLCIKIDNRGIRMWKTYEGHLSFSLLSIWIKSFEEKNELDLDEA